MTTPESNQSKIPSREEHPVLLVTPDANERPIFDAVQTIVSEMLSESSYRSASVEDTEDWEDDQPCPCCGSEEIHILRVREETFEYNADTDQLEYESLTQQSAVPVSSPLHARCADCGATLLDTALHQLIDFDTL